MSLSAQHTPTFATYPRTHTLPRHIINRANRRDEKLLRRVTSRNVISQSQPAPVRPQIQMIRAPIRRIAHVKRVRAIKRIRERPGRIQINRWCEPGTRRAVPSQRHAACGGSSDCYGAQEAADVEVRAEDVGAVGGEGDGVELPFVEGEV